MDSSSSSARTLPPRPLASGGAGFGFDDDGDGGGGGPSPLLHGRSAVASYRGDARRAAPSSASGGPFEGGPGPGGSRGRKRAAGGRRDAFPARGRLTLPVVLDLGGEAATASASGGSGAGAGAGAKAKLGVDRPTVEYGFGIPPRYGGRCGASFGFRGGARGRNAYGGGAAAAGCDVRDGWGISLGMGLGDRREVSVGTTLTTASDASADADSDSACVYRAGLSRVPDSSSAAALALSADRPVRDGVRAGVSLRCGSDATFRFARLGLYSAAAASVGPSGAGGTAGCWDARAGDAAGPPPEARGAGMSAWALSLDLGRDRRPIKASVRRDFSGRGGGNGNGNGSSPPGSGAVVASLEWGPRSSPRWSVLLRRTLSDLASFGVGVGHSVAGGGGLAWLFRFERGDVRVDVPLTVSAAAAGGGAPRPVQAAYLAALSGLVDAAAADLLGAGVASVRSGKQGGGDDAAADASSARLAARLLRREKARADAERQTLLMSRQAESKRRAEESRGGLVVVRAAYGSEGGGDGDGDGDDSAKGGEEGEKKPRRGRWLDVTRQLQFWVADSTLRLPPSSKKNLLGFYDVADDDAFDAAERRRQQRERGPRSWRELRRSLWRSLWSPSAEEERGAPVLVVQYKFEGATYQISVKDEDALLLPNPHATLLRPRE